MILNSRFFEIVYNFQLSDESTVSRFHCTSKSYHKSTRSVWILLYTYPIMYLFVLYQVSTSSAGTFQAVSPRKPWNGRSTTIVNVDTHERHEWTDTEDNNSVKGKIFIDSIKNIDIILSEKGKKLYSQP